MCIISITGAIYGLTIELYSHPIQIHIVGSRKQDLPLLFFRENFRTYSPLKVVELLDPGQDKNRLKELGYPVTGKPSAYMCFEQTCKSVKAPKKLLSNWS